MAICRVSCKVKKQCVNLDRAMSHFPQVIFFHRLSPPNMPLNSTKMSLTSWKSHHKARARKPCALTGFQNETEGKRGGGEGRDGRNSENHHLLFTIEEERKLHVTQTSIAIGSVMEVPKAGPSLSRKLLHGQYSLFEKAENPFLDTNTC